MDCAAKGSRTSCIGPATRRCPRCSAVAYCSLAHQVAHSTVHKRECERLRQQMKRLDVLKDFPFTFTEEAARLQESRCSFLIRHGVHGVGMWICECACGISNIGSDDLRLVDCWNLPSELCPCKEPSLPILKRLTSWKEYYEWRHIPLCSPVSLLLHWPLTIYWAIQHANLESFLPETGDELRIHYLGPEREIVQLAVFGELRALFPGVKVQIDLIGPSIPQSRDGERIDLHSYAKCSKMDCPCNNSTKNNREHITLRLHSGFYHDCYLELAKHSSSPHIIIAPNAGIAAYTSWLPTLELIKEIKVPAIFTDFCEEASHLAARCVSSVTGVPPKFQIQINPFRQPLQVEEAALFLPCYSNCFLLGF